MKREREAKGISLQEISAKTKIGVRLLKALEDEQFDLLPGGIFDKSFLRQYARFLGLDEDHIVSEYLRATGASPEPQTQPPVAAAPEQKFVPFSNADESPTRGYLRVVSTAVLLGAVIAGGFYAVRQFAARRDAQTVAPQATAAPPVASPTPEALPPSSLGDTPTASPASGLPGGSRQTATPAGTPSAPPVATDRFMSPVSTEASALVLNIEARKECWVSISADGQKQWQGILEADRSRRVEARDSFRLTIGDAGAVTLTLNGKPLPAIGRSGEVRTITISSKGLTQPEP
ncbi:MAG: helix-turn-helix domain-containing protein [Acidobacteria bacterium]|nr:helix-turn-helix domain-containing protein [Acidobacteriota bacterium]